MNQPTVTNLTQNTAQLKMKMNQVTVVDQQQAITRNLLHVRVLSLKETLLLSTDLDNNSCSTSSSSSPSGLFEDDSLGDLLDDTFDQELLVLHLLAKEQRNFQWHQKKLSWDEHVAKLLHKSQFSRTY